MSRERLLPSANVARIMDRGRDLRPLSAVAPGKTLGGVYVREVRELARRFSAEQLECCLTEEIDTGDNPCDVKGPIGDVVNVLAEAEFVRDQVDRGVPLADAIRDLAGRMRAVQRRFGAEV